MFALVTLSAFFWGGGKLRSGRGVKKAPVCPGHTHEHKGPVPTPKAYPFDVSWQAQFILFSRQISDFETHTVFWVKYT